ncbi:hypothetical protein [Epilithonimonas arachidiradicis]|uniref:hypothetical protein n=1 Tax=Epilithonimonas arachidiradicis TaxID=1617282 RepID=UPI0011C22C24|nr:hypothetical protein [Epilithonimonas arachidiradicis]
MNLMRENPDLHFAINEYSVERLHFRFIISSVLAISDPTVKTLKLLEHLKGILNHLSTLILRFLTPENN